MPEEIEELRNEVRRTNALLDEIARQTKACFDMLGNMRQHIDKIDRIEEAVRHVASLAEQTDRDTREVGKEVSHIKIPHRFP